MNDILMKALEAKADRKEAQQQTEEQRKKDLAEQKDEATSLLRQAAEWLDPYVKRGLLGLEDQDKHGILKVRFEAGKHVVLEFGDSSSAHGEHASLNAGPKMRADGIGSLGTSDRLALTELDHKAVRKTLPRGASRSNFKGSMRLYVPGFDPMTYIITFKKVMIGEMAFWKPYVAKDELTRAKFIELVHDLAEGADFFKP